MERAMKFDANGDHYITLADLNERTRQYRHQVEPGSVLGGFFDRDTILTLLAQPGAVGVRYYHARETDGTPRLILVGTDENRHDIFDQNLVYMSTFNPHFTTAGQYDSKASSLAMNLRDAARLTANYRKQIEIGQPVGGFIAAKALQRMLSQTDCIGTRFYYAIKGDNLLDVCWLAMDHERNELHEGFLLDKANLCPPFCDELNPLNAGVFPIKLASKIANRRAKPVFHSA